jgi:very-short-patch-repair endonuclease
MKVQVRSEHEELFAMQLRAAKLRGWERDAKLIQGRKWEYDFSHCIYKIIVEIEGGIWTGGRHVSGAGFQKDCEKYNAATLRGYRLFRFTPEMVASGEALRITEAAVEKFAR